MAEKTLSVRLQQRTDLSLNWTTHNPVLLEGEIGIESDTGLMKIGDGTNYWSNLGYFGITTEYLAVNYLPKTSPTVSGVLAINSTFAKILRGSTTPDGNNIGVTGLMLISNLGDEGGLLIHGDGAYLWNSTDNGSLIKMIDSDLWSDAALKKDATFAQGLLLDLKANGDLQIKGKLYQTNGTESISTPPASSIAVNADSRLGNHTNLQSVLNYIANVLDGTQTVSKIKANNFDAV